MSSNKNQFRRSQSIHLGNETLIIQVRESTRVRGMRLVMSPRRPAELIVPEKTSSTDVSRFLQQKHKWVAEKHALIQSFRARPAELDLEQPSVVWLLGRPRQIQHAPTSRTSVRPDGQRLMVGGNPAEAAAAIERWYRRKSRQHAQDLLERHAKRLGLEFRNITIRDQQTRWGSCSASRNLSFSWRLIMAPPEVFDYVAVHELCHLREPNHSKAFWRLLDVAQPTWPDAAEWLRRHGQELRSYNPRAVIDGSM
ncbi:MULTISPECIES: M48 family metallopeptidase [Streptomyces]|uniref:M48 family metallopeptidase n=1 Tax=Streptomyces TaxID=1883 RepID=UPI002249392D|nr:SprT family zinc-dependent metalloprotease [Streptomyces sp. JHD 1]MCX2969484.1 SprT family zinc-dependent metalloprotease [Streptomyces sp. JHD 1]